MADPSDDALKIWCARGGECHERGGRIWTWIKKEKGREGKANEEG